MFLDFETIVASFYELGYRLYGKDKNMTWIEFMSILQCLGAESPLGRLVQIRLEKNNDIIKEFTPAQKKIRSEWAAFRAEKLQRQMAAMNENEKENMKKKEDAFVSALFSSLK